MLRRQHRLALPLLAHSFSKLQIDEKVVLAARWSGAGPHPGIRLVRRCPARCSGAAVLAQEPGRPESAASPRIVAGSDPRFVHAPQLASCRDADSSALGPQGGGQRRRVLHELVGSLEGDLGGVRNTAARHPAASSVRGRWPVGEAAHPGEGRVLPRGSHASSRTRIWMEFFAVFAERPDLELVVVGTGPLGKTLEQMATPNIELLGNVNDHELRWLYGHAHRVDRPSLRGLWADATGGRKLRNADACAEERGIPGDRLGGHIRILLEDLDASSISGLIDKLTENPLDGDEIRDHVVPLLRGTIRRPALRQQVSLHVA